MKALQIAIAVAYTLPPMRFEHAALHGMTTWPHGHQSKPFLARGPLTLAQHGLRLGITSQHTVVINPRS